MGVCVISKSKWTILAVAVLALVVSGCGQDESSVEFSLSSSPDSPIVINADKTITIDDDGTDTEKIITKPWFLHRLVFENASDQTITLIGFRYTVSIRKGGVLTTSEFDSDEEECAYVAEVPANTTIEVGDETYKDQSSGDSATKCREIGTERYIESLAEGDDFNYRVKVEPLGWVGSFNDPQERLTGGSVSFTTQ